MEVSMLIRQRLKELGLDQRDLADAADVTESYISQLLRRKKAPPAPDRTDIYDKLGKFLKLPPRELATLADLQRRQELKKKIEDPPKPLFREVRELILRKCKPAKRNEVRAIFERHPFGELERMVTQKLLDVVKTVAREELNRENGVRLIARTSGKSYKQMRVAVLEFLEVDLFSITAENCLSFLDPMIMSWDIDLATFALDIVLDRRTAPEHLKRFEFVETRAVRQAAEQPGLREFLNDPALSQDATEEEVEFLKRMFFRRRRRPTALYYYRELQNLRDPLHFRND